MSVTLHYAIFVSPERSSGRDKVITFPVVLFKCVCLFVCLSVTKMLKFLLNLLPFLYFDINFIQPKNKFMILRWYQMWGNEDDEVKFHLRVKRSNYMRLSLIQIFIRFVQSYLTSLWQACLLACFVPNMQMSCTLACPKLACSKLVTSSVTSLLLALWQACY